MAMDSGLLRLAAWFLISLVFLKLCVGDNNGGSPMNDEVLGLIVFKSEIDDPSSILSSWNEDDESPCSWEFIQCNPLTGRVSEVSINGLGLSGRIGRGLEKLQSLKTLSLSRNNLSAIIGSELLLPQSVQRVDFSHNRLSGIIPFSIVHMNSIRILDFSSNLFSGNLADSMFDSCSSLHFLSLADNLIQGPIPSSLSKCSPINSLNLSGNHFSGDPDLPAIFSLYQLRSLDLSNNDLSGSVPQGLSAINNLIELRLQSNQFSGTIPTDLGLFFPHLAKLDLSHNQFTGTLPESLRLLKSLSFFSLADNKLSGEFPLWIGNMSSLEYIDFSTNDFHGDLPVSLGELKSLNYLSLSNNKLAGGIPATLMNCKNLSIIKLRGNRFNGSIPKELFELELEEIDLSNNDLSGSIPIPSSSSKLAMNKIAGDSPAGIRFYTNLRYLNMSWNHLHTRIPQELGFFPNLTALDLRESSLLGSIPSEICDSGSLRILRLDGNSLIGSIPEEIQNCSSLYLLSLSDNNLTGSIPKSISKLNELKILKLEFNKVGGEIPGELGKMESLLVFNVSFNRLIGRLPIGGIFGSLDRSSLQGNLGLCTQLLKGPCMMDAAKPLVLDPNAYIDRTGDRSRRNETLKSINGSDRRTFFSISAIVAICAAALIAGGVIVISLLNARARGRSLDENFVEESKFSSSFPSSVSTKKGKLVIFDSEMSRETIGNLDLLLDKAYEIGEGVNGKVFKVSMDDPTGDLAVKRLVSSKNMIQYLDDFDREIRALERVKHPNLMLIRGYYWSPQVQLLITEYVTNGSLQMKLHERPPSTPALSWADRFRIVIGTAKGLAHLHHSNSPAIVHYNVKPSNILLDDDLNPKISDCGLAKLVQKHNKDEPNKRFDSGSLGYNAPELACNSMKPSMKCDVYGFGVVILEIVTGRRAVEYKEHDMVSLIDNVREFLIEGDVLACVDPNLCEYEEDEVVPLLRLALVCTSQIPSSRPSMAEVLEILQVIATPIPHRMGVL